MGNKGSSFTAYIVAFTLSTIIDVVLISLIPYLANLIDSSYSNVTERAILYSVLGLIGGFDLLIVFISGVYIFTECSHLRR